VKLKILQTVGNVSKKLRLIFIWCIKVTESEDCAIVFISQIKIILKEYGCAGFAACATAKERFISPFSRP